MNFSDYEKFMPYSERTDKFVPTEYLKNRAQLFRYWALYYVFSEHMDNKKMALRHLDNMIRYHIVRLGRHQMHKNAYIYFLADQDMRYFAEAVYNTVKMLHLHKDFARYIASEDNNTLEEALLECAYRKKDKEFADWLIDNEFYGRMQTELFQIIYRNDRNKAAEIASKMAANCIAWILRDTCEKRSNAKALYIAGEIRLIFENIIYDTAAGVRMYVKGYSKRGWIYSLNVYETLMNEFFAEFRK